jgi:hypothetical protein
MTPVKSRTRYSEQGPLNPEHKFRNAIHSGCDLLDPASRARSCCFRDMPQR